MSGPSRYVRLPQEVQDRLKGSEKRLVLSRLALDVLPLPDAKGGGISIRDISQLTGFDRVDVANAMKLLTELDLVIRVGNRRNVSWFANPHAFVTREDTTPTT